MKIKSKIAVLLVLFLALFVLVTPAFAQDVNPPGPPDPVAPLTVPNIIAGALAVLVTYFVTGGLKQVSIVFAKYKWLSWIPRDGITGLGTQITAAIVVVLVATANMLLSGVPPETRTLVANTLYILTILLSTFGVSGLVKSSQAAAAGTVPKKTT